MVVTVFNLKTYTKDRRRKMTKEMLQKANLIVVVTMPSGLCVPPELPPTKLLPNLEHHFVSRYFFASVALKNLQRQRKFSEER